MKGFLITWLTFLCLLSLTLTGAFYLGAHANEFGSTTTTTLTKTSSLNFTRGSATYVYNATTTGAQTFTVTQKVPTPDYTIPILIFVVLAAAGVIVRVAIKRMKK